MFGLSRTDNRDIITEKAAKRQLLLKTVLLLYLITRQREGEDEDAKKGAKVLTNLTVMGYNPKARFDEFFFFCVFFLFFRVIPAIHTDGLYGPDPPEAGGALSAFGGGRGLFGEIVVYLSLSTFLGPSEP
ncbi:MAG: hypothetical protein AMS15_02410 [Planctomycetes bacterium DG_23]|nr:MAG: hypothetical protein AMS15_02410 [Planctomycetes bacterium DG_23]